MWRTTQCQISYVRKSALFIFDAPTKRGKAYRVFVCLFCLPTTGNITQFSSFQKLHLSLTRRWLFTKRGFFATRREICPTELKLKYLPWVVPSSGSNLRMNRETLTSPASALPFFPHLTRHTHDVVDRVMRGSAAKRPSRHARSLLLQPNP